MECSGVPGLDQRGTESNHDDSQLSCVSRVQPRSHLRDVVYEQVKSLIIANQLLPGTLLSINDLVERLGVSRTPIREALVRLQSESLVDILPQRAIRIAGIAPEQVRESFAVRELLECAAVENASQTVPIELLNILDQRMVEAERLVASREFDQFLGVDLDLHSLICTYSGNGLLSEMLRAILERTKRIQAFSSKDPGEEYARVVTAEHRALVDALRRRDANCARSLITSHLQNAVRRIEAQISVRNSAEDQLSTLTLRRSRTVKAKPHSPASMSSEV